MCCVDESKRKREISYGAMVREREWGGESESSNLQKSKKKERKNKKKGRIRREFSFCLECRVDRTCGSHTVREGMRRIYRKGGYGAHTVREGMCPYRPARSVKVPLVPSLTLWRHTVREGMHTVRGGMSHTVRQGMHTV